MLHKAAESFVCDIGKTSHSAQDSFKINNHAVQSILRSNPFHTLNNICIECDNQRANCLSSNQWHTVSALSVNSQPVVNCVNTCHVNVMKPGNPEIPPRVNVNECVLIDNTIVPNGLPMNRVNETSCQFLKMLNILTYLHVPFDSSNYLSFLSVFCYTCTKTSTNNFFQFRSFHLWKCSNINCDDVFGLNLPEQGLRMGHVNVRHLIPKVDQLKILLTKRRQEIDILGVTETFLKKHHSKQLVDISGYVVERKDRKKRAGGGIAVYLSDGVPYVRWED